MEDKDNQKRMEEEFLEIFTALNKHLEHLYEVSSKDQQQKVFVLGDGAPCALDAVLLGGIYAHFYQDPIPRSIIQSRFPFISKWLTENLYVDGYTKLVILLNYSYNYYIYTLVMLVNLEIFHNGQNIKR